MIGTREALRRLEGLERATWIRLGIGSALLALAAVGLMWGVGVFLLSLALGVLLLAIWFLWSSLLAFSGETELTLEEALTLAAPSAEEEQKRAVLRTLKDLEFEFGVGKLSEADYIELREHYRGEAKRLLQLVETAQAGELERAEGALRRHLRTVHEQGKSSARNATPRPGSSSEATNDQGASEPSGDREQSGGEEQRPASKAARRSERFCRKCRTRNEADARFCKACGAKLPGQVRP